MYTLHLLCILFYKCQLHQSVIQIFCGFAEFFCLVVLWIAGRGVLCVQYYNCGIIYFFLLFYQFFLHVVWGSVIKGIHIYNAYVFLMNCAIYPYDISLFVSGNILVLKSILYNTSNNNFILLMITVCMVSFLFSLTFNLSVSLYSNCVS